MRGGLSRTRGRNISPRKAWVELKFVPPSQGCYKLSGNSLTISRLQLLPPIVSSDDIAWEFLARVGSGPGLPKCRVFAAAAGLSIGLVPAAWSTGKAGQ